MRHAALQLLPISLLLSIATAIQIPQLQPFLSAILDEYFPQNLYNITEHELLKRQSSNACPKNFNSCANLGAANLCCMKNAICSADYAGHVACCPSGAACTGTIGGVITSGTIDGDGGLVSATGAAATTATGQILTTSFQAATSTSINGLVPATSQGLVGTETGSGFIVDGTSTVASPNSAGQVQMPLVARAIIKLLHYIPI